MSARLRYPLGCLLNSAQYRAGSSLVMLLVSLGLFSFAGIDAFFLKRGKVREAIKNGIYCLLWSLGLVVVWYLAVFIF